MTIYYSEDHEWLRVEKDEATLGITLHAAEQLGDVVFLELKEVGSVVEAGAELGVIESVKAASEIYAPVSGEVLEINQSLLDEPGGINASAESEDGWLCRIRLIDSQELEKLMDAAAYKALVGG